ncbi:hypothetical protein LINGRAHAP2_LOCUS32310 [Linum grandiflorum]
MVVCSMTNMVAAIGRSLSTLEPVLSPVPRCKGSWLVSHKLGAWATNGCRPFSIFRRLSTYSTKRATLYTTTKSKLLAFRELLKRDLEIELRHSYREGNHAADHLANRGMHAPLGFHLIPIFDPQLRYFFL